MFDIGFQEMVLIMVLALIVFGPSKLPELGKMIGRAMREFRRASDEFRSTVETNLHLNDFDSPTTVPAPEPPRAHTIAPPPPPPESVAAEAAPAAAEMAAEAGGVATEQMATGAPYWAQRGSRLFHSRGCAWAARIAEGQRVPFETAETAREEGYVACPVCEALEARLAL